MLDFFVPMLVCCRDFLSVTCENREGKMLGEDVQMFKPIVLNLGRNVLLALACDLQLFFSKPGAVWGTCRHQL